MFSSLIQPNQEIILKKLALETLVEMLKGLTNYVDEYEKSNV